MSVAKEQIVGFIRARGDDENADRAENELPETVDLREDADLLAAYGVSSDDLDDPSVWGQ